MSKQLKDYLHLYLGCQIRFHSNLTGTWGIWNKMTYSDIELAVAHIGFGEKCQIQLRPLSDMTEEEMLEVDIDIPNISSEYEKLTPKAFTQLLQWGFDLFGLIESGLAIDKTKNK
jgi:hypothetical protein